MNRLQLSIESSQLSDGRETGLQQVWSKLQVRTLFEVLYYATQWQELSPNLSLHPLTHLCLIGGAWTGRIGHFYPLVITVNLVITVRFTSSFPKSGRRKYSLPSSPVTDFYSFKRWCRSWFAKVNVNDISLWNIYFTDL